MPKTRILIVEDESLVARDIQAMILNLGFAVAGVAPSGEQALKEVEDAPPDLILMDIVLKGPLDGIATAAAIRSRRDIPIIYLTAYADESTMSRAKLTDPFGYLLKPFEERELQTTIEMALHKHARELRILERERWTLSILDSLQDAVVAADVRGRLLFMNTLAGRITGWDPAQVQGRSLAEILPLQAEKTGRGALPSPEAIVRKGRWSPARPLLLIAKDLRPVPVEATATLLHDTGGAPSHLVFIFRKRAPAQRRDEAYFHLAVHDPLTGLPNRFLCADRLTLAIAHARRRKLPVALILIAPDRFAASGLRPGSPVGDKVLREIAGRLAAAVRKSDTVARIRDDRFLLILPEIKKLNAVPLLARRIQKVLKPSLRWRGRSLPLLVSMGICLFPGHGEDVETLVRNAESALLRAKAAGGDGFHIFSA